MTADVRRFVSVINTDAVLGTHNASWLNMVEIEIGILRGQCLDRRIDDPRLRGKGSWRCSACGGIDCIRRFRRYTPCRPGY